MLIVAEARPAPPALRSEVRSRSSLRCRRPSHRAARLAVAFASIMRRQQILIERSPVHTDANRFVVLERRRVTMDRKFSSRRLLPTLPGLIRYFASARAHSG